MLNYNDMLQIQLLGPNVPNIPEMKPIHSRPNSNQLLCPKNVESAQAKNCVFLGSKHTFRGSQ